MTANRGISICAHLMVGFPNETLEHYIETAQELSTLGLNYLKIHQLQIVKQTIMGGDFLKNPFPLLNKEQYIHILANFLGHLSPDIIIQRVAGDCPPELLIASGFNDSSNVIKKDLLLYMREHNLYQGCRIS